MACWLSAQANTGGFFLTSFADVILQRAFPLALSLKNEFDRVA
jgi:hypothetical protein